MNHTPDICYLTSTLEVRSADRAKVGGLLPVSLKFKEYD
jgi:hypothetical protein